MVPDDCFELGQFIKPHGYKGGISIKLDVDRPEDYENLESVFVIIDNAPIPFFFTSFEHVKEGVFRATIEGVETEEDARALCKKTCFLPLDVLPKLTGTKFYFHEVIGFTLRDTEYGDVGSIEQILDGTAQPLFSVKHASGREVLIPLVDELVLEVNREEKFILVNAPEGLVDFYVGS